MCVCSASVPFFFFQWMQLQKNVLVAANMHFTWLQLQNLCFQFVAAGTVCILQWLKVWKYSSNRPTRPANCYILQLAYVERSGSGDSSVVRAPDSWLKSRGFESLREGRENFLLQGQLSVLTLISVTVPPPCYCSKRSGSFCQKCRWQVTAKHATPYVCGF